MHTEIIGAGDLAGKPGRARPAIWLAPLTTATLALAWRGLLLALEAFPFNADEAVVGLMARHILAGERPTFFYGQAYMGSLDAGLVALGFAVFGQHVLVIRAVQVLLYSATVLTAVLLACRVTRRHTAAWASGLILAIPPLNVTLYSTVSLGGYGEALLIGNLLTLVALVITERPDALWPFGVWGLLAGLGWWAFGLTLVYSLPSGALLVWVLLKRLPRRLAVARAVMAAGAALVGASPWLGWATVNGLRPLLSELAGSAIAGASPPSLLAAAGDHLLNLLVLGSTVILGLRPPWEVRWLALPLLPLAMAFWLAVLVHLGGLVRQRAIPTGLKLLLASGATLLLGFVLTPFGADPSGRYFVPLATPMAVLAGDLLTALADRWTRRLAMGLLFGLIAFHAWGTLDSALRPPGLTTQFDANTRIDHAFDAQLIAFLEGAGETRGYTTYWVAYPLAFLSDERLVYVPRLPYHPDLRYTPRDDRYPPYDEMVATSPRVAFITARHPVLDGILRQGLARLGVEWEEVAIGDYRVFYRLSRPVRPQELGLGGKDE
ncbi:MAG: hypothetical protein AB1449_11860 [Chloroflexota bacterium]